MVKKNGWNGFGTGKIRNADTIVAVQPEHKKSLQISKCKLGWWGIKRGT
jgi:hypothetical protein